MQQARVISVTGILGIQLPVCLNKLTGVPENANRAIEDPIQPRSLRGTQIVFQRLDLGGERGKDEPIVGGNLELAQRDSRRIEIGGIPAFAFDPSAKRHSDQIPAQIITPLVIDTHMAGTVAAHFPADESPAVCAAIDKGMKSSIFVA